MEQTNDLVVVINQSGLDTSKSESLMQSFAGFYQKAKLISDEAKKIKVTDISQKDDMAKAKELRLQLRDIRTKEVEVTRVKLKEQSLREGKAIDGISNIIKALIVPAEEYLELQEKFAENIEKQRLEKQYNERVEKLSQYVTDVSLYSLKDMADEVFENLLAGCKANFEKAQEEQRLAEEKQKQENEMREKLIKRKIAIAPYMSFTSDLTDEILQKLDDEDFDKIYNVAKEAKETKDNEQELIRLQNIKLQQEKDKAEENLRKEKEAKAQKEADEKAKAEADKKAQEEADRQKLLAPDKVKILDFAIQLSKIEAPAVKSNEANQILSEALKIIITAVDTLQNGAKKL